MESHFSTVPLIQGLKGFMLVHLQKNSAAGCFDIAQALTLTFKNQVTESLAFRSYLEDRSEWFLSSTQPCNCCTSLKRRSKFHIILRCLSRSMPSLIIHAGRHLIPASSGCASAAEISRNKGCRKLQCLTFDYSIGARRDMFGHRFGYRLVSLWGSLQETRSLRDSMVNQTLGVRAAATDITNS